MTLDKYSLTWQTYSDHLKSMMKELMINGDFADVTLVTEDKKHIKAHMNILSACSPVFRFIFPNEKSLNPIIYLRGINFYEMEAIMQFIYLGEATFYEERINEVLSVAKSLEIKKLYNSETEMSQELNVESSQMYYTQVGQELKEQPDQSIPDSGQEIKGESCQSKYECEKCHQRYNSRQGLDYHKKSSHDSVRYACNHCDYKASHNNTLTAHIKNMHEGDKHEEQNVDSSTKEHIQSDDELKEQPEQYILIRGQAIKEKKTQWPCEKCHKIYATRQGLHSHKKSSHGGIKYACNQCDYETSRHYQLIAHVKNIHDGIKYACIHCEFKCESKESVEQHILEMH